MEVEIPCQTTARGPFTKGTSEVSHGRLKHGNPSGDPNTAPRCGARTRGGAPCRGPAIRGKARCRMHGGKSTGPRTPEGLERSRRARWKHGSYSAEAQQEYRQLKAECRALNAASAARHAVLMAAAKALLRQEARALRNVRRRRRRRMAGQREP